MEKGFTLKSANVMVHEWVEEKYAFVIVDLIEVFILVVRLIWGFYCKKGNFQSCTSIMVKDEKMCFDNQ
jgi:flagellar biogenesis protein FliO